jgi:hypothetical protein
MNQDHPDYRLYSYKDYTLYVLSFDKVIDDTNFNHPIRLLLLSFPPNKWYRYFLKVAAESSDPNYSYSYIDFAIRPGLRYVQSLEEVSIKDLPLFLHWHRGTVFDQLLKGVDPSIGPLYSKGTYV